MSGDEAVQVDRKVMMDAAAELDRHRYGVRRVRNADLYAQGAPEKLQGFARRLDAARQATQHFLDLHEFAFDRAAEETRIPALRAARADHVV